MNNQEIQSRKILGVRVDFGLSVPGVMEIVRDLVKSGGNHLICTTSPYFIMKAQDDPEFLDIINRSVLSTPDGYGVLYAKYFQDRLENLYMKYKNKPYKFLFVPHSLLLGLFCGIWGTVKRDLIGSTVTGVDLTDALCKLARDNNYSVFLLGGGLKKYKNEYRENGYDMASHTADILREKYPGLKIIGATSKFSRDKSDDTNTVNYIKKCMDENHVDSLDILIVAYGAGDQEKWVARNQSNIPAKVSIGVGRVFDYITGNMKIPPKIFTDVHLEWLYSMIIQPNRLRRVITSFPIFTYKVYMTSICAQKDIKNS